MNNSVRHVTVPQYEGLALKDIAQVLNEFHPEVYEYLPDSMEIHKVSKEWICNVCASVIGSAFNQWVKAQCEARNLHYVEKKKMNITMDEEIAAAYRASTKVSCKYRKIFSQSRNQSLTYLLFLQRRRAPARI